MSPRNNQTTKRQMQFFAGKGGVMYVGGEQKAWSSRHLQNSRL